MLADIKKDFPQWYQDVIAQAELADQSPTRGAMVIRPYGYALWEHIQSTLDKEFKKHGVQNAYFPLLIPESFLKKEAKHVEGFAPELAIVTHAGGKKLEEPYVVRPTSETMVYTMFAKWIKSYRDLPLKINQWANVVRWELRTRPFLRTSEFLWQEGHTAHASNEEAGEMATTMLEVYTRFIEDVLAVPVVKGEKSANERFAGAAHTYTMEGLMQDGKALQMGTSHVLEQSFSKAFDIQYQDKDSKMQSPYCTSWGISTRLIGALIMTHGDQQGLVLPPRIAPHQVVIVPICRKDTDKEAVMAAVEKIEKELVDKGIRVIVDADPKKTPGAKFFHWESRGVPVRIELGPRDVASNQAMMVSRIEGPGIEKKKAISLDGIAQSTTQLLDTMQKTLLTNAKERVKSAWHQGDELTEFGPKLDTQPGFYQTGWCGNDECEAELKQYKGTLRCILPDKQHAVCFACKKESIHDVLVAKAY